MTRQPNLIDHSPISSGTVTPDYTPQNSSTSSSTYGLGSVLGLWRRLSSADNLSHHNTTYHHNGNSNNDMPPHLHQPHAQTFPQSGISGDGIHGAFTPPRRTASPRGLPSLEPLQLTGYKEGTGPSARLLSKGMAEEIRTFLPERLKIGDHWSLVYSLDQDGSSLGTLYKKCDEYRGRRVGFVLVVRDGADATFGAYLTEAPHPAPSYFGTGECFLWRASVHAPLPPPPSADTTNLTARSTTIASPTSPDFSNGNTNGHLPAPQTDPTTNKLPAQHSIRFQNFPYSGSNDYCIFCESSYLSVGGGTGGHYGLWLSNSLDRGHSSGCDTFANPPLSDEGEKFDVLGVEVWVVGAG